MLPNDYVIQPLDIHRQALVHDEKLANRPLHHRDTHHGPQLLLVRRL